MIHAHKPLDSSVAASLLACFLCDLLIQRHGRFHISLSHQRIYPKWTVPTVDWMTEKQVKAWRQIISGMTQELQSMIRRFTINKENALSAPLESRACLPLSSVPSSVIIPIGMSNLGTARTEARVDLPSVSHDLLTTKSETSLKISPDDLPISPKILTDVRSIHFLCSQLTVVFDFDREFVGTISLKPGAEEPTTIQSFAVEELSCIDDSKVAPIKGEEDIGFKLQVGGIDVLHVEFTWDSA